ncbi:hypothetical protein AB0J83_09260 [Actinoplanes sp. NPDC049596]|uniref:hypothetical protein n=1 Tax=unclassified Actinoplanes TaxID=2626549 RepID=UPI00343E3C6F
MRRSAALLILVGALAGCSTVGSREEAAAGVATRLLTAAGAGDGDAACAVLAPATVKTVAEDEPCPEAILGKSLPKPGTVVETSVYGQWAQVKLDDDTIFLAAFPEGWRVVAAGCTPQASRPYDCTVEGD